MSRIHSECLTGDALFSQKCDCGPQLQAALAAIQAEGRGVLVYLRQEGRGIGLINKIRAYALQDQGMDTVEANLALGLPVDARDFSIAKHIYDYLNVQAVKLLTNNPEKLQTLRDCGTRLPAAFLRQKAACTPIFEVQASFFRFRQFGKFNESPPSSHRPQSPCR